MGILGGNVEQSCKALQNIRKSSAGRLPLLSNEHIFNNFHPFYKKFGNFSCTGQLYNAQRLMSLGIMSAASQIIFDYCSNMDQFAVVAG